MPVAKEIFQPLVDLYQSAPADEASRGEYLVDRRAQIKLLADTITEQVLANVLGSKTRNSMEARRLINTHPGRANIPADDEKILVSLSGVLSDYSVLSSDPYIDRSSAMVAFADGVLRKLCQSLAQHTTLRSDYWANALAILVRQVP